MYKRTDVYTVPGFDAPIVLYRRALTLAMTQEVLGVAEAIGESRNQNPGERGFRASKVLPYVRVSFLGSRGIGLTDTDEFSLRVNTQGPEAPQGWHQDYVPEAAVLYPEGEGCIDINLKARELAEARRGLKLGDGACMSIPVGEGDIAVIGCGFEAYHRGRNTTDVIRRTVVVHDLRFMPVLPE